MPRSWVCALISNLRNKNDFGWRSAFSAAIDALSVVDGEVNVLLGKGIAKTPAVIEKLRRQNFAEPVAVEYEKEGDVNEDIQQDIESARKLA